MQTRAYLAMADGRLVSISAPKAFLVEAFIDIRVGTRRCYL